MTAPGGARTPEKTEAATEVAQGLVAVATGALLQRGGVSVQPLELGADGAVDGEDVVDGRDLLAPEL
eukprot:scaffold3761_cov372-Prasinococcus_capsulatus_cf.AAC.1